MQRQQSAINSIDVRGLPQEAVASLQQRVHLLRQQASKTHAARPTPTAHDLIRREFRVTGNISRSEIYKDVG